MVFMLLTGWLVEHYSYVPAFVLFGMIPLVCTGILWTMMGPLEPEARLTFQNP
jgi:ACS family hexuronate transporter-like MFS transporter